MNWKQSAALSATLLAGTMLAGCEEERPAKPTDPSCTDFEYDSEEGVWYCDDDDHSSRYYHGGKVYGSKSALRKSGFSKGSSSVKGTGGFGKSGGGTGG